MLPALFQALARLFRPENTVPDDALARLGAAEQRLRPVTASMEARFLACGAALEDLTKASESLVEHGGELVRLAAGDEETGRLVGGTMSVLAEPMALLERYSDELREQMDAFAEANRLLGGVLNLESDLQAAVAPLRATRTMFRVEASRLPEAERAAFLALADQIEVLHDQVRDTLRAEFAKLSDTRRTLTEVFRHVDAESARKRQELGEEKTQIEEAVASLNRQIESRRGHESRLNGQSRAVASAVSRAVLALQSQDIVAQRTQHLFEGIGRIRELGTDDPARLRTLAEMQFGRASGALQQIGETGTAVGAAMREILAAVEGTGEQAPLLKEFGEVTASASGAIQVLLGIVDKIREMSRSAAAVEQDTRAQIAPLNSVTTRLSDRVDQLSHQMNLVALNAQIQAVRIEAGTGLEVLAAHTAAVAMEAARLGEAIRASLERFQQLLRSQAAAGVGRPELWDSAGSQEDRLRGLLDAMGQRMEGIGADVRSVQEGAARVARASLPASEEEQSFADMREALRAIADRLDAMAGRSPEDILTQLEQDDHHAIAADRRNHLKIAGAIEEGLEGQDNQVELF